MLRVNDSLTADEHVLKWLQARGAAPLNARSTAYALELMKRARVDLVISDLAREEHDVTARAEPMDVLSSSADHARTAAIRESRTAVTFHPRAAVREYKRVVQRYAGGVRRKVAEGGSP